VYLSSCDASITNVMFSTTYDTPSLIINANNRTFIDIARFESRSTESINCLEMRRSNHIEFSNLEFVSCGSRISYSTDIQISDIQFTSPRTPFSIRTSNKIVINNIIITQPSDEGLYLYNNNNTILDNINVTESNTYDLRIRLSSFMWLSNSNLVGATFISSVNISIYDTIFRTSNSGLSAVIYQSSGITFERALFYSGSEPSLVIDNFSSDVNILNCSFIKYYTSSPTVAVFLHSAIGNTDFNNSTFDNYGFVNCYLSNLRIINLSNGELNHGCRNESNAIPTQYTIDRTLVWKDDFAKINNHGDIHRLDHILVIFILLFLWKYSIQ